MFSFFCLRPDTGQVGSFLDGVLVVSRDLTSRIFFIDREQGWDALWEIILLICVNILTPVAAVSYVSWMSKKPHATPAWTVTDIHWVTIGSSSWHSCALLWWDHSICGLYWVSPPGSPMSVTADAHREKTCRICWQKHRFFFGWQLTLASIMWNPNDQHLRFFNKWLKYA